MVEGSTGALTNAIRLAASSLQSVTGNGSLAASIRLAGTTSQVQAASSTLSSVSPALLADLVQVQAAHGDLFLENRIFGTVAQGQAASANFTTIILLGGHLEQRFYAGDWEPDTLSRRTPVEGTVRTLAVPAIIFEATGTENRTTVLSGNPRTFVVPGR